MRPLMFHKPLRDLKSRLMADSAKSSDEESRLLHHFTDLLDKVFVLNPEKRLTVEEGLLHPFLTGL